MKTLAQVVVHLMEELVRADEGGIDGQACGDIINAVWFELAKTSSEERQALASAAFEHLQEWLQVDERGFTRRSFVTPEHRDFLEGLTNGSAWEEFDHPEAEDA